MRLFTQVFGKIGGPGKKVLENQTSFGQEFKSKFGKKSEPVRETVNEIRQLIDDQIFNEPRSNRDQGHRSQRSQSNSSQTKNKRTRKREKGIHISEKLSPAFTADAKAVLESSLQVLKELDMNYQDLLDDLSFDDKLEIPIIHVRQHLKVLYPDPDDYRRISGCLKYLDRNKNGSAHYLEIFDFFNGSINSPRANQLEQIWVKHGLKRGLGADVAKLIKSKNEAHLKGGLQKGLGLLFNKKAKQKMDQMSESEILRAVNRLLERNGFTIEDVIDDLDFDANFDVSMIDLKNVFREKLEKKEDLRMMVRALRTMDTNMNGNVNFTEFVDFTKRLDEVSEEMEEGGAGGFEEEGVDATESSRPIGRMIHDLGRSQGRGFDERSRGGRRDDKRGDRRDDRRNEGRMNQAGRSKRAGGISQRFAHNRKFLESQMVRNLNKKRHEQSRSRFDETGKARDI